MVETTTNADVAVVNADTVVAPPVGATPVISVTPPQHVTVVPPSFLENSDRRKNWALAFLAGGGIAMTVFASAVLFLLRAAPAHYAYWLGMAAMLNIFMIFTGLLGMFVKRTLNVSKNGIVVEDKDGSKDQSS